MNGINTLSLLCTQNPACLPSSCSDYPAIFSIISFIQFHVYNKQKLKMEIQLFSSVVLMSFHVCFYSNCASWKRVVRYHSKNTSLLSCNAYKVSNGRSACYEARNTNGQRKGTEVTLNIKCKWFKPSLLSHPALPHTASTVFILHTSSVRQFKYFYKE